MRNVQSPVLTVLCRCTCAFGLGQGEAYRIGNDVGPTTDGGSTPARYKLGHEAK